ncbi:MULTISPECIES: tol-pal system-associated acyl-CoA thioesterase [Thiorhodovibrio]|uniref:tol-pal system-associated acyl-CoA thioesterase n=1 Tax=Thiorhodovibrio TaxID=61593 RepID=UPI00191438FD|nr:MULTISPECIES: tol-pal system-associated acyl-CoA thioesterase [Thiorhodovibrio]MBK5968694.1 tol-pal system-associated acyl-CoA thioesterase [Thiorhodovibrio winogradskyi]WPL10948.1 Acyl-CoA thioester hydrolase YbgC [Thiorhodovibrio litoralis]
MREALSPSAFVWPVRVYYEDTDAGGLVYHANYLRFFERARTEWLRALGYEQDQLREDEDLLFVARRAEIRFQHPARFNDALLVSASISAHGGASIDFDQDIRRQADGQLCCSATFNIAAISAARQRPKRIPQPLLAQLFSQPSAQPSAQPFAQPSGQHSGETAHGL